MNAYFGETGEAAEASAEIVKNVYGSGVGQSMDAVAEAVIMVKKNLGDLGDTDLTNLTKQALTLEELYGIDMNETLRGCQFFDEAVRADCPGSHGLHCPGYSERLG